MTALATIPSPWRINPALRDPAQALWSELRFARAPIDEIDLFVGAIRHFNAPGAARGTLFKLFETLLARWADARLVAVTAARPPLYQLERKWLRMASPPNLAPAPRPAVFPRRTQRQRLWSAMRVLRDFDLPTLLLTAEVRRPTALDMIRTLERGGWLRRTGAGWTTAAARKWSAVAPTFMRRLGPDGPFIRITEPANGAVIDLPVRPRALRDRRSGRTVANGGGVNHVQ